MATNSTQEAWIARAVGRAINPDNAYGLQCVDVADDYAVAIFPGVPWQKSLGGVNGARDFKHVNNTYFKWIPNIVGNNASIPQRGDVVIWDGSAINPYGHVAVVLSATASAMTVIQQDGYLQVAAHVATLPYDGPGTGPCLGWLRPQVKLDPPAGPLQRVVGPRGVYERKTASSKSAKLRTFKSGDVLTLKGYVVGERLNGLNLWYVGISGHYFHCSGFTQAVVGSLKNLTPAPALKPNQRKAGKNGAALRATPDVKGKQVATFKPGDTLNFVGWKRGARPYGPTSSDIWLVGISGAYVWSGAVDKGNVLTGLPERK